MPFSALQEKDFVGRQDELSSLYQRVLRAQTGSVQSAVLSGPQGIGKSELLKQLFGILFWKQDRVAPFYYAVNPALLSVASFSKTYLIQFLCQRLAFEKKEQSLIYRDGISIDGLSILVENHDAVWAKDILEQYTQSSDDPVSMLRVALEAPHHSTLATGIPVAVLIDEFHRLQGLHVGGTPDPKMVSLFEVPMSFRKTPHLITGNVAEVQETPVSSGLERIPLEPLGAEAASSRVLSLLRACDIEGTAPPLLMRRLGGNPFYLGSVINRVCRKKNPVEKDFWNAYVQEIREGSLALSWVSVLKSFFPDLAMRRTALAIIQKIYHAGEPIACQRIATSFSLTLHQAEAAAHALYLAGFIQGEFGVFRAVEDLVLRDIIDYLYMKEILAKPAHDLEQEFLEKILPEREETVRYDMTLPMVKEAELVAAQCLDQLGKNLQLNQDAIGQLQIAVIEACINAMEHSKGTENKIHVSIAADGDHLEVSIESDGQEFVEQETGEPFGDRDVAKTPGRGWGIKLMKRFADEVRFEKTGRGTKIVLVKKNVKSASIRKEESADRE
jgi:serine/threonine-protein kinase RsbW